MARLAQILVYPIKSLDGLETPCADVLPSGALRHDRRFALVDPGGRPINGKRRAALHTIRAAYDHEVSSVELSHGDERRAFRLPDDCGALGGWLTSLIDEPVQIAEDARSGFPDDTISPGPTVISTATLRETGGWFGLDVDGARRRFRTNLEVDDVEPFWEDRLAAAAGHVVRFRIGGVVFDGINPCQRCVVPSRDPDTGTPIAGFVAAFSRRREAGLPGWADRDRFDHFYRLAINTRLAPVSGGGPIRVGDEVDVLETRAARVLE